MTIDKIKYSTLLLMQACLLTCSLCATNVASSEETAPHATASATLTKLQDLTNRASELIMRALSTLGIRYKYGGSSPENGMDCSGLVRYVFKETRGTDLPRTSEEISQVGQPIDAKELQPGDLVFFNTKRRAFSHVGIYLGDSRFIHSPSAGGEVRIESMAINYWRTRFSGARRIDDQQQGIAEELF